MGYYSALDTDLTYGCQNLSEQIASLDAQSQDEAIRDCEMIRETLLALFHENCESSADSYGALGRIFQIDILIKKRESGGWKSIASINNCACLNLVMFQ